jgi:hypothetical protein
MPLQKPSPTSDGFCRFEAHRGRRAVQERQELWTVPRSAIADAVPGRKARGMSQIARLKITLDNVEPEVLRRVEVPIEIKLDRLHLAIQIAMGWENYHLYEFRTRAGRWGIPDPDLGDYDVLSAEQATLAELLQRSGVKTFQYVYDFGDDWEHTVKVEAVAPGEPDALYPRLLEAQRACPPEDCGGPWDYAEYLEAISDPQHERHEDLIGWRGPGFDPAAVDKAAIRKGLQTLARPRPPRKASKAASRPRQ